NLLGEIASRTTFVGREAERSTLRRLLAQARLGRGRVVMIAGAAGIGKTRLSEEFAVEASNSGFLALTGGCYDRDDLIPFIPFVEILESAISKAPSSE